MFSVTILLSYILLGFTLAAPIGPVNSARIDKGIKNGFWHAWIVGFGSMLADGVFMILVYIGMVHFLEIDIIQIFLWLFGGFILVYTGMESIVGAQHLKLDSLRGKDSLFKCFLTGFIMSITSPLSILFWLGIYGSILAKTAQENGTSSLLIYSSMIFLGLTLWDLIVAALTNSFRRFLTIGTLRGISIISGASLVIFGVYFGYQGMMKLFFSS
ncbi:lysine exporter protein LysE/YggA [Niallia circulans]|uniref:LysE family transporter n=1 Tax=Niallia circulans TaxID=1397 RepID=UPI00077C4FF2|nr:LysE family transporter [Niallia circulans]MDR4314965.1 amino acid transporter [Niallia circulans]MED3837718.1 LysE family transporter [Niallia circulans]MED4243136.1 LysE family transporter [Niallia circulans]MED4247115.1 LysE family transporter [Niallia circulans]QKH61682.1 LysE family transporter [Niallia circulans]